MNTGLARRDMRTATFSTVCLLFHWLTMASAHDLPVDIIALFVAEALGWWVGPANRANLVAEVVRLQRHLAVAELSRVQLRQSNVHRLAKAELSRVQLLLS